MVFALNWVFVFLPANTWLTNFFLFEDFLLKEGTDVVSYYHYRYWIALGIVVNCITTFAFEKVVVVKLTEVCDRRQRQKKV
jgi:hypothetical protein